MNKEILIVKIKDNYGYEEVISKKIEKLGVNCVGIVCWQELDKFLEEHKCNPNRTLLHYRTTGPKIVTPKAYELEGLGYRLINSAKVLDLTGDKFTSYKHASKHGIKLPITKKSNRNDILNTIQNFQLNEFILKPRNSVGQGAFCFKSSITDTDLEHKISQIPSDEIIIQEIVRYTKIYRVIVIGGKVLDKAVFFDQPNAERWKVSVCLNPEMKHCHNPDPELLAYAKRLADIFKSEIAFVDVYQTKDAYILSEINTACALILHEEKSNYDISNDIAEYLVSQL